MNIFKFIGQGLKVILGAAKLSTLNCYLANKQFEFPFNIFILKDKVIPVSFYFYHS